MTRPTIKDIAEAREQARLRLSDTCKCGHSIPDDHYHGGCDADDCKCVLPDMAEQFDIDTNTISTLLAATEPPTDDEIVNFAVAYYEQHNLGDESIRTHTRLHALLQSSSSYRVSAMRAIVRFFFGSVKL